MKNFSSFFLSSALLAAVLLMLNPAAAQAKIWRIDNNAGSPGDFTTAQAAHDAAAVAVNDTLYFNGSGTTYGALHMTKRLYVFGPGFFLTQNSQTQAAPNHAYLDQLRVDPGAAGSLITGMTMYRVYLFASNILFKRNYVASSNHAVVIGDNNQLVGSYTPSNVLCVQNYISTTNGYRALWVAGGCSNIIVTNNFIHSNNPGWQAVYALSSLIFSNNTVYGILETNSTDVTNTYLYGGSLAGGSNSYHNNIGNGTQFPAGNGNVQNQPIADVCVNTGSDDGLYQLKPGSPAIGAGLGGVDIGMFGGADPYVLSGLPAIPAIWSFSAPSSGSGASGLNVNIKAKSHN
ncbi:hypothetical protein [Hymenobacter ruricola]|uniref:Right-handed parallel beta-helix repeat-containing protein n=1 Tax=Hymenobacter ruricola TaxID=2791023 RepID=A0ABS0HYA4_9BACT|nr:hypothetical protein [Hymenobacter ruricola]MBF9219604.1 hypothetical protein [Hymenobacter ruricola]